MSSRQKKCISTRMKAERVKELVRLNYEPGRQDRCLMWVYRHVVRPSTGISVRTYFRYLSEIETSIQTEDPQQLKLF